MVVGGGGEAAAGVRCPGGVGEGVVAWFPLPETFPLGAAVIFQVYLTWVIAHLHILK